MYRDLDMDDLSFDRACLEVGKAWEAERRAQLPPGTLQPVIVVG